MENYMGTYEVARVHRLEWSNFDVVKCKAEHAKYQTLDEDDVFCPSCRANRDYLDVTSGKNADEHCLFFHVDDQVHCQCCHKDWTGEEFIASLREDIKNDKDFLDICHLIPEEEEEECSNS